jgi:prevent-host-death family protein
MTVTVAELKRRFAELVADVRYRRERILVLRRRTPVAALVGLDDLAQLAKQDSGGTPRRGLLAAIGAWGDDEELDRLIHDIYEAREASVDRPVEFPP